MACQYFTPCEHGANTFTVAMPKLTFGRGCLQELGQRAAGRGFKRVALITDPFLRDSAYVETAEKSLREEGLDLAVFSDIRIEPDDQTISKAADFIREGNFDAVVSVGGGSSMDTAKAGILYAQFPTEFTDYFAPPVGAGKPIPGPLLPHIACPTTSGTGSECTSVSVIRLNRLNTKFVIGSPHMMPVEALVDPACCDSLPGAVVSSTGFDLLCHAIECYTAKAYTRWRIPENPNKRTLLQGANPWSELAAARALEIVDQYLVRGVADNTDHEARDQLMWGAALAGMAFGNSGTHLPHAMSYGITHLMDDITTEGYDIESPFVPHGFSVAVNAPAIFRYLSEAAPERHLEAANYLGADSLGAIPADAGEVLAKRLVDLMKNTAAPNGLSGVGFGRDDIKALTESSVRQGRSIENAPRLATASDIEGIYSNALSYW